MYKNMFGNHCDAMSCKQEDNTVTEGYISSEQLQLELARAGENTVSYIEKLKAGISDEDIQALKEQIKSEEFREQLRKATETAKEKINQIYETTRLSRELGEHKKSLLNTIKKAQKQLEIEEINKIKEENESLKAKINMNVKQ